jgi:hypothetical protein
MTDPVDRFGGAVFIKFLEGCMVEGEYPGAVVTMPAVYSVFNRDSKTNRTLIFRG